MSELLSGYQPVAEKWNSLPKFSKINERQLKILTLCVNDQSDQLIAEVLGINEITVRNQLAIIKQKLGTIDGLGDIHETRRTTYGPLLIAQGFFTKPPES